MMVIDSMITGRSSLAFPAAVLIPIPYLLKMHLTPSITWLDKKCLHLPMSGRG